MSNTHLMTSKPTNYSADVTVLIMAAEERKTNLSVKQALVINKNRA